MTLAVAIFFKRAKIFCFQGMLNLRRGVAKVAKNAYLCYMPL